jgi:hypothetical protein
MPTHTLCHRWAKMAVGGDIAFLVNRWIHVGASPWHVFFPCHYETCHLAPSSRYPLEKFQQSARREARPAH